MPGRACPERLESHHARELWWSLGRVDEQLLIRPPCTEGEITAGKKDYSLQIAITSTLLRCCIYFGFTGIYLVVLSVLLPNRHGMVIQGVEAEVEGALPREVEGATDLRLLVTTSSWPSESSGSRVGEDRSRSRSPRNRFARDLEVRCSADFESKSFLRRSFV